MEEKWGTVSGVCGVIDGYFKGTYGSDFRENTEGVICICKLPPQYFYTLLMTFNALFFTTLKRRAGRTFLEISCFF